MADKQKYPDTEEVVKPALCPAGKYETRAEQMIARGLGVRAKAEKRAKTREKYQERDRADLETSRAGRRAAVLAEHVGQTVYVEPAKERTELTTCDVLVVGGGPAGLSAALGAARAGADTVLIEKFGCFGGTITTVGMETIAWYRYEGTVDSEGIGTEMERRTAAMGGSRKWACNDSECLDAEYFKVVADELIRESKVRPLLHTTVVEVIKEGRTATGVLVESKSGRQVVWAKRIVDCTGDADVAFLAGARCRQTPKESAMAVTMVFNAAGVNTKKFTEYTDKIKATYADWSEAWPQKTAGKENHLPSPYLEKQFVDAKKAGVLPHAMPDNVVLGGSWSSLSNAGEATNLNLVHLDGIDPCNVKDLTYAEMEGRKQTLNALAALKETVPGFEDSKLRNFAMTIGVRDTRKILGKYCLTATDVLGQARFDDSVGIFPEFVDGYAILVLPTTGRFFHVPYRCLQSPDVDNILVAGRCVAGDKTSHAAMRNIMACTVSGQGAGVAAAVSCKLGVSTDALPIDVLQKELRRQQVKID